MSERPQIVFQVRGVRPLEMEEHKRSCVAMHMRSLEMAESVLLGAVQAGWRDLRISDSRERAFDVDAVKPPKET